MNANRLLLGATVLLVFAVTGCFSLRNSRHQQASSVVQFLYPDKNMPFVQPAIPTLRLPLRVGVAFVPSSMDRAGDRSHDDNFSEAQKTGLMRRIADAFKALPFVQSIEILPDSYLRPGGGFENLDQLRALMGVDVIALVSYDQAQNSSDTAWSLSYWTIVGAYIVPAQKNDTHTLMEAVVYDIASRSLLFRAPGVSAVKGNSTLLRTTAELRSDSARGLAEAATDLTTQLQRELDAFKIRVREEPASVHIEHKPGYSGAGAIEVPLIASLALLIAGRLLFSRTIFLSRKTLSSLPLSRTPQPGRTPSE
jgi:rhombotail lipoprotein